MKNFPSIICFFRGFEIPKMAAEVLFEVKAVGRDLGMVRGCHFSNRKTREKANYTRIIFWTLRKNNEWRRVLFQIFWFFPMKIKIIVKKFVQVLRKLSKCEKICQRVWKKNLDKYFAHGKNQNNLENELVFMKIFEDYFDAFWHRTLYRIFIYKQSRSMFLLKPTSLLSFFTS